MEEAAQCRGIVPIWVSRDQSIWMSSSGMTDGCQQILDWMDWKSRCDKGGVIVPKQNRKKTDLCFACHPTAKMFCFRSHLMCCTHHSCLGSLDCKSYWQTRLLSINFWDFSKFPVFAKATANAQLSCVHLADAANHIPRGKADHQTRVSPVDQRGADVPSLGQEYWMTDSQIKGCSVLNSHVSALSYQK